MQLRSKVFELSQTLRSQWITADYPEKRRLLEIVFWNCRLDDATLVPEMRKPFDVLAEGLLSEKSRGDRTPLELFMPGIRGLGGPIAAILRQGAG
jgi:site-specific DNA recombinase